MSMTDAEYGEWIRSVRKRTGLTQEEFGRRVCRYIKEERAEDRPQRVEYYKRNSVGLWEKGEQLPRKKESFLAIALMEYDAIYARRESDGEDRYRYALDKLKKYLGQDLWERRTLDYLLASVCRGVTGLDFANLPEKELALQASVDEKELSDEEQRRLSASGPTLVIRGEMSKARTVEDVMKLARGRKEMLSSRAPIFEYRMIDCFCQRSRYPAELSLRQAICLYAPNYRISSQQSLRSMRSISRNWLIDLCVHLRFERHEINSMLENVHHDMLEDDPEHPEYWYGSLSRNGETLPVGSGEWYRMLESMPEPSAPRHYRAYLDLPFRKKLLVCYLMAEFLSGVVRDGEEDDIPPVDYLLEPFLIYRKRKEVVQVVNELSALLSKLSLEDALRIPDQEDFRNLGWDKDAVEDNYRPYFIQWANYIIANVRDPRKICGQEMDAPVSDFLVAYRAYKEETRAYYCPPAALRDIDETVRFEGLRLRCLAALMYTVFTGRQYNGSFHEKDLLPVREQLVAEGVKNDDNLNCFITFLNQLFFVMLSGRPVQVYSHGGWYCVVGGKSTQIITMEEIMSILREVLSLLPDEAEDDWEGESEK